MENVLCRVKMAKMCLDLKMGKVYCADLYNYGDIISWSVSCGFCILFDEVSTYIYIMTITFLWVLSEPPIT